MLGELSFDKKNESYIKINEECEKEYRELSKNYSKNVEIFN